MPTWTVRLKESVIDDLLALGRANGRKVLEVATQAADREPGHDFATPENLAAEPGRGSAA